MVNVEAAFTDFVRKFGGEVVEDIVGPSPDFLNADYVFREVGVVAELKRMVQNKAEDQALRSKIQSKFDRWMAKGTIGPIFGRTVIQSDSLPVDCQRELLDVYKPPLQGRILKANKQIKQTIARLGVEPAQGLVIIVNDGNYALEANAALYLINRILGNSFRRINSVVYCTVNMFAKTPLTPKPTLLWVHGTRRNIVPPIDPEFLFKMFRGWRAHLQQLTGEPIDEVQVVDGREIDNICYVRET